MTDQQERLIEFQQSLGISMRAFESSLGMSSGAIKAANSLSQNALDKACSVYPVLNRVWVLTGIGKMTLDSEETTIVAPNFGTAQQVGVGNHLVTADAEELERLRTRVHELEKELSEKDKTIARLEGRIEAYKEMRK